MKRTRSKLALLAASAAIAALVAAGVAFNLFIGWKVEADAQADIDYAFGMSDEVGTGRTPNYVLLDSSYRIDSSERRWETEEEVMLADWFANHPEEYVIRRVMLDGWTCYAAIAPASDFARYADDESYYYPNDYWNEHDVQSNENSGYYIAYIDIASEESLIATVNTAFALIGIVGALAGAYAGAAAGRRIEESQEAQKRFYENMSHDLKTPLAAIRGYAEGAGDGILSVEEATQAIVGQTESMTETINEILKLSRLEAKAVQPQTEPVEVSDFVQDCLMPFEGAVRTRGLDVQLDLATGVVQADPGLLDHALSNVLSNAVRHAATCVRVSFDGTCLAVWNDGGTPDATTLPHLFKRFHAGSDGQTGIGLAIAKEVAALHGWSITAQAQDDGLEVAFHM